jgi:ribosome-associated translation inhibitor RaiA
MTPILQTTFLNTPRSEAVIARIQKEVDTLGKYNDRITRCHVQVEAPAQHHHHGIPFQIRIELHVPGKELVVAHTPTAGTTAAQNSDERPRKSQEFEAAHQDAYIAIRDSFRAMRRQLKDHTQRIQNL